MTNVAALREMIDDQEEIIQGYKEELDYMTRRLDRAREWACELEYELRLAHMELADATEKKLKEVASETSQK